MAKIEASVIIDRPVEDVWNFISDLPNNAPKWNIWRGTHGVLEVKQTSAGSFGVGTTIQSRWSTRPHLVTSRITEYEPGRKIVTELTSPQMIRGTRESLSLEGIEGKTKFNAVMDLKFSGFYRLLGPSQVGSLRGFNEARVGHVKRILESEPRP